MRRIVGLVLAGLGTCLIVFAVLMPTYVSSRVVKFPLNQYATATLVDSNASYFSPTKLTELSPVTMEATYTLKGNSAAGSGSTAVWNEFTYVYDQTNKLTFQQMTRTMAFDRRSAQLVNCCGANVNGDSSVQQRGIVGYVFPLGTQKQTYQVFDPNLLKPVPFTFAGTDSVNGIQTYRFVEDVSPTQDGSQTLPGSLVGMSQATVTLPQFYQAHVTYWIDPDTGVLLKAIQGEKVFLRNPSGAQALLLFNGNLVMTPASVKGLVAIDNDQRSKKAMVETVLPLVTGIAGVVLLIAGIFLGRKPREDAEAALTAPDPGTPAPAAEPEATVQPAERPSLVPGLEDQPTTPQPPAAEPSRAESAKAESPQAETSEAETPGPESPQAGSSAGAESPEAEAEPESPKAGTAPAAETAETSAAATVPQPTATATQPAAVPRQNQRRATRHRR
jgi:outer membrane biosynthesis protein TonB